MVMTRRLALVVAVLVGLGSAARAQDKEEKVPLDQVPRAVMDAVKKRFPKAEVVEATKEVDEEKKPVYEVTVKQDGKTIDVTLSPEGVLAMIEKEIEAKDLPKAVADAVEAKYPKATYKIVEELIAVKDGKESLDAYEVLVETADKKGKWELKLAKDGKVLKTEDKSQEKDDKGL
jgi:Putative beta-lactamase-inhibitor-like, PepSY-like